MGFGETIEGHALWQDWLTIWQSEFAALATDREAQEMLQREIDVWAARAMTAGPQGDPAGRAGAAAASGTAPLAAAPGFALPGWLAAFSPPKR